MVLLLVSRTFSRKGHHRHDILVAAGHPALASNPVTIAGPGGTVLATSTVSVADLSGTIRPERVVEAVVCSSLAGSERLALLDLHGHGHGDRGDGQSRSVSGERRHFAGRTGVQFYQRTCEVLKTGKMASGKE